MEVRGQPTQQAEQHPGQAPGVRESRRDAEGREAEALGQRSGRRAGASEAQGMVAVGPAQGGWCGPPAVSL